MFDSCSLPPMRTLIPADRLARRVRQLGAELTRRYAGEEVVLVPLMDGSFCFVADLVRTMQVPRLTVHFARASSYSGTTSTGEVTLSNIPDVTGRHVVIVDDILDTGATLSSVSHVLRQQHPASLETCVLLDKPSRRSVAVHATWAGFTIGDQFVIGYGLDWDGRFRHLPDVCVVLPQAAD
jgi:hypoxanthine phosphoribosyltransferase